MLDADVLQQHHYSRRASALWRRALSCTLVLSNDEVHRLEGAAPAIWDLLVKPMTAHDLTAELAVRFSEEPESLRGDVDTLLTQLLELGAVTVS